VLLLLGDVNPSEHEYWEQCRTDARACGVRIVQRSNVPWKDTFGYHARALALAQPSWFETPGLSALEAAAMGTPVVCTEVGSAREYFGPHARYCSPDDVATIRRALDDAREEKDPAARASRAAWIRTRYTWDAAARATLSGYASVLPR
jgi:glycosyltransferase involved in cell wall biosynthesis